MSGPGSRLLCGSVGLLPCDPRGHAAQVHFTSGKTNAQRTELGAPAESAPHRCWHRSIGWPPETGPSPPLGLSDPQGFSAVAPASADPSSLPWDPAVPWLDAWVTVSIQAGPPEGVVMPLAGHHPTEDPKMSTESPRRSPWYRKGPCKLFTSDWSSFYMVSSWGRGGGTSQL